MDDGTDVTFGIRKGSELEVTPKQVWEFAETRELSVPSTLRGGVCITGDHQVDAKNDTTSSKRMAENDSPDTQDTDLSEAHNDDRTFTIELVAIGSNIGHSGDKIDTTSMKNTIDTVADVITYQVGRFTSSDNADVNALSSSLLEYVIVPDLSCLQVFDNWQLWRQSDGKNKEGVQQCWRGLRVSSWVFLWDEVSV